MTTRRSDLRCNHTNWRLDGSTGSLYIYIWGLCVCVCATYISMEYLLLVKADRRATDRLPCSNIAPCCNHSSLSLLLFHFLLPCLRWKKEEASKRGPFTKDAGQGKKRRNQSDGNAHYIYQKLLLVANTLTLLSLSLSQRRPINKNTNTFNQTNNSSRARAQSPKQLRLCRYINTNSRYYVYSRAGVESQQPTRKSFNWLTGFSDFWFSLGSSHPTHTK